MIDQSLLYGEALNILESKSFKKQIFESEEEKDIIKIDENLSIDSSLVEEFVAFCKEYYGINSKISVFLSANRDNFDTLAYYETGAYKSHVYCKNRAVIDCLRSLAHEIYHNYQDVNDLIPQEQNYAENDSEKIENDANAKAGEVIRKFGRLHKELYEL